MPEVLAVEKVTNKKKIKDKWPTHDIAEKPETENMVYFWKNKILITSVSLPPPHPHPLL